MGHKAKVSLVAEVILSPPRGDTPAPSSRSGRIVKAGSTIR